MTDVTGVFKQINTINWHWWEWQIGDIIVIKRIKLFQKVSYSVNDITCTWYSYSQLLHTMGSLKKLTPEELKEYLLKEL